MQPDDGKLHGLFINPAKANCSIYESGCMAYKSLLQSDRYVLDYLEIDEKNREIPGTYDFYAFNYHHDRMAWLDTRDIRRLPGLKVTFILETLPNDPFVLCPYNAFDAYCALDPTMHVPDKRVYAFPRPLEIPRKIPQYIEPEIPVIGSFGFATPGKGFELVVDAVNREFDEAVVRINIPSGTFADNHTLKLHNRNYAEYLEELCKKVAKKGIEVVVTHDYMTKEELIEWCSQNTLNCFLYNRMQPGLSATTDQAISSGRPLAVSTNETFRHIHQYVRPYPFRTLKESIRVSQPEVFRMQKDWSPKNFAITFEKILQNFGVTSHANNRYDGMRIKLKKKRRLPSFVTRVVQKSIRVGVLCVPVRVRNMVNHQFRAVLPANQNNVQKIASGNILKTILIVSPKEFPGEVYEYATNCTGALQRSIRYNFIECVCSGERELDEAIKRFKPSAILYNYFPIKMSWLTNGITRKYAIPHVGIRHGMTQEEVDQSDQKTFDIQLCLDPTLSLGSSGVMRLNLLIPSYINMKNAPDEITFGSFGLKINEYMKIIQQIQHEYEVASININIPVQDTMDKNDKNLVENERFLQSLIKKHGIHLHINHENLSKQKILEFLAGNSVNIFWYDETNMLGILDTLQYALAVQRPIAVNKCRPVVSLLNITSSIFINDVSLQQIISNDIVPLVPFYNIWSEAAVISDFERLFDKIIS